MGQAATYLTRRSRGVTDIQAQKTDMGARWALLYRISSAAAWITAVVIPVQVVVFSLWPPPVGGTVQEWFDLFAKNPLIGLINLDLLLVLDNVLLIPVLLALTVSLRKIDHSLTLSAMVLGLVSVILYFATNPAIEIWSLSARYQANTGQMERSVLLAAGEALVASWQGTAFHVAYLVGSFAGIFFGFVMLRSDSFGKAVAYMGLAGNLIGLGLYVPVVGIYISVFSVLFLEVWYILIGGTFYQLARKARTSHKEHYP